MVAEMRYYCGCRIRAWIDAGGARVIAPTPPAESETELCGAPTCYAQRDASEDG